MKKAPEIIGIVVYVLILILVGILSIPSSSDKERDKEYSVSEEKDHTKKSNNKEKDHNKKSNNKDIDEDDDEDENIDVDAEDDVDDIDDVDDEEQETEDEETEVDYFAGVGNAPDFTVELNDGRTFTLSQARGKVVLLNIWATWCGPCCVELPAFEDLNNEYGDEVEIIAVNYAEDRNIVDQFIQQNGYTFPVGYDTQAKVATLYPSTGIPFTVVVDKFGNVRKTFIGANSAEEQYRVYKDAIEDALND